VEGMIEVNGVNLWHRITGEGEPVVQIHGAGFGHFNLDPATPVLSQHFRVVDFDMRGYGASDKPLQHYDMEVWADDIAALQDALGISESHIHGTSMGGMIAIAFTALYPQRTIAACADVAFAKPDVYRKTLFRVWRRMAETMAWDDFSDHVTTQAVGAKFLESEEGKGTFELVRTVIGWNDPYTVRQANLAMENMDLTELVPKIDRPLLMTNGTYDILCPPELAPSGLGARQMAAMNPKITTHEFPDIGHADLLECPADAVRIVTGFFRDALDQS
jgi:3-oxoadipate enol-lactonase